MLTPGVTGGSVLYINDINVVRTNSTTQVAEFTVSLIPPDLENTVTVDYSTNDRSALAGQEYTAASGTLTFVPDTPTQVIDVTLTLPTLVTNLSLSKTFSVDLTNPVNATIGRPQGVATIDYSQAAGVLGFASPSYSVNSNIGNATIGINRMDGGAAGVSVNFATSDATARAGTDYIATAGILGFSSGQTTGSLVIPILPKNFGGGSETVNMALTQPSQGASLGSQNPALLTITNVPGLVVTNTNDSGPGSLRQVMLNAQSFPGRPVVTFDIPGSSPFVIDPLSPLPAINAPVTIDGTSQPGYAGLPLVVVDGEFAGTGVDGFTVNSGQSVIEGLAIDRFGGSGIVLQAGGANLIEGDFIGVGPDGRTGVGNHGDGIAILGSAGNVIGGTTPAARNLLSANAFEGIEISGPGASGNVVEGDFIGTAIDGTSPLGNGYDGAFIDAAAGNEIGGTVAGAGDLIAANRAVGVQIDGATAIGNQIQGDNIGVDVTGEHALGNRYDGVFIDGAPGNVVGGSTAGSGNLISGNHQVGVRITGPGASGNAVLGDWIGTDATGTHAIENAYDGVFINGAANNRIGGMGIERNLISGNGGSGLQIFGPSSQGNIVWNNLIGTDASGTLRLGNALDGVFLSNSPFNQIGGSATGEGNVISANGEVGLQLYSAGTKGNVVEGNLVGLDANGHPTLGNLYGIFLNGAGRNTVQTSGPSANSVAGNKRANVINGPRSAGPLFTQLVTQVEGGAITGVTLQFNQPLATSRAGRLGNYAFRRLQGGKKGRLIRFGSVAYDPNELAVTLTPRSTLDAGSLYRLSINGRPDQGVTGADGQYLDGDRNGLPGGNAYALFGNKAHKKI